MLPDINRILFATDLSDNSSRALAYAASIAKDSGAEIYVLHVVEEMSDDAKITMMMFMQDENAQKAALEKRRWLADQTLHERQDKFWGDLEDEDREVRAQVKKLEVVEGFPAEEILRCAESGHFDLIVLGAHEHGISHSFLGTTAKRVMRRTSIPTLVVPRRPG